MLKEHGAGYYYHFITVLTFMDCYYLPQFERLRQDLMFLKYTWARNMEEFLRTGFYLVKCLTRHRGETAY